MDEALLKIDRMIEDTKSWRVFHRRRGDTIQALACSIRQHALEQARDAVAGKK